MHLIQVLASGIIGCANGTASLYKRGTSTPATWYVDFEATSSNSNGNPITLDGNGGAIVYVNELVTVIARDANGTVVRTFVAGDAGTAVEVISDSFTGTDYASGSVGVSKPTTLAAVLDKVNDSFGASDWQVLFNGSSMNIQNALASLPSFINVKSPTYGAKGDGITDDTAAINAAITAAGSNNTLFFPAGTYKITTGIAIPSGVSLFGTGIVVINCTHATQNAITFNGDGSYMFGISVEIGGGASGSGDCVRLGTAGVRLAMYHCFCQPFSGAALSTASGGLAGPSKVTAYACLFQKSTTGTPLVNIIWNDNNALCLLSGCEFKVSALFASVNDSLVRISYGSVTGCRFDFSNNASGTLYGVRAPAIEYQTRPVVVSGCNFNAAGASGTIIHLGNGTNNSILDAGNDFGTTGTVYSGVPTNDSASAGGALSAIEGNYGQVWASGNITLEYDRYSHAYLNATFDPTSAPNTISFGANIAAGRTIALTVRNGSGGAYGGSMTLFLPAAKSGTYAALGTATANGHGATFIYRCEIINSVKIFLLIGSVDNYTT